MATYHNPKPKKPMEHKDYYGGKENTYEAIKVIEAWQADFCLGNALKYIARAGKKDKTTTISDLQKAIWYIDRKIEQLKKEQIKEEPFPTF